MNLPRIYLIAILLLAFGVGANGQEPPKAVLVDEFGDIPCEDLKARTDSFFAELNQNPADLGYVIIPGSTKNSRGLILVIRANIFTRQFDRGRVRFSVAPYSKATGTQFWRVPSGAEAPISEGSKDRAQDASKAFRFGFSDRHDLAGVCPTFSPDDFADFLEANPGSLARLVIFGPSSSSRRIAANNELESFKRYTDLPVDRIEFYFVHRPDLDYTMTEYWYLPAKKS